jgi:hypothetical protein
VLSGQADRAALLPDRQGIEILGPVGVAARTAPTVGAALEAMGAYLSVYSPAIRTSIEPTGDAGRARGTVRRFHAQAR